MNNEKTKIAEQSVIGAILIEEKSLGAVIDIIQPEDFYFSDLRDIYKTILELSSQGRPIDFITVLNQVISKGQYSEANMKCLLLECAQSNTIN